MKLILLLLFISNFAIANCNNKFLPINYVDFSTNLVNSKDNINILKLYKQEDNRYTLLNTNFETTITHMGSIEQINSSKEIYFSNVILSISKSDIKLSSFFDSLLFAVKNSPCNINIQNQKPFELLGSIPIGAINNETKLYILNKDSIIVIILPQKTYYEAYAISRYQSELDIQLMYLEVKSIEQMTNFLQQLNKI